MHWRDAARPPPRYLPDRSPILLRSVRAPVSRDPDQLLAEVLALPVGDRARLAESVLASLDEDEAGAEITSADVERAWAEEAVRRAAEIDAGTVKTIPADEVFRELREELRARRGE